MNFANGRLRSTVLQACLARSMEQTKHLTSELDRCAKHSAEDEIMIINDIRVPRPVPSMNTVSTTTLVQTAFTRGEKFNSLLD